MSHTLVSASELARKFDLSGQAVGAVLARDDVSPAYVDRSKSITLYDSAAAEKVLQAYVESKRPAAPAPAAVTAAPPATTEIVTAVVATISDLFSDFLEELKAIDAASRERDRQVFRAVEALGATLAGTLPSTGGAEPTPLPAPPPTKPVAKPPTPPRVLIIGLLNAQVDMIRKEFGECFKLTFVGSDETRGHGFDAQLNGADHVVLMTAFCNHGLERVFKRKDKDLRRVTGGMSSLRTALTDLYVAHADKVAA